MNDLSYRTLEYVTSAGLGTMLSLGVVDNLHSAKARARVDELKQAAQSGHSVKLAVQPCDPDSQTGK